MTDKEFWQEIIRHLKGIISAIMRRYIENELIK
jgi:hypothetical protein